MIELILIFIAAFLGTFAANIVIEAYYARKSQNVITPQEEYEAQVLPFTGASDGSSEEDPPKHRA